MPLSFSTCSRSKEAIFYSYDDFSLKTHRGHKTNDKSIGELDEYVRYLCLQTYYGKVTHALSILVVHINSYDSSFVISWFS